MARLFTCGFEENNLVNGSGSTTMWTSVNNSPALSTTTVRSGTYSLRVLGNGGNEPNVSRSLGASVTSGTYFLRFYYRFPTLPAADIIIAQMINSGGTASQTITLLTTGGLRLTNVTTGATDDGATTLSTNTWYRIELRVLFDNSAGEAEVRLNGAADSMSITGVDTLTTNFLGFTLGVTSPAHVHDSFFDDVALNDATGSFQTSWPGACDWIYLVAPTSDDAVTWTKAGSAPAATNHEGVDDVPGLPDDGTTYNEDSGTTNEDRFGHGGLTGGGASDTMVLMDVYARVSAGAASQTARLLVWDNSGSQTTGPSIALGNGTWAMCTTAQHLVVDLAGKSLSNVDAYDIGYEGLTGASSKRVSALWANVEGITGGGSSTAVPVIMNQYRQRR